MHIIIGGCGRVGAALADRLSDAGHDIVVIDTLRNILQLEQETDNSEVAATVNPWITAARDHSPATERLTRAGPARSKGASSAPQFTIREVTRPR
jgi:nucleoside-diphosphate-sugar epimerase